MRNAQITRAVSLPANWTNARTPRTASRVWSRFLIRHYRAARNFVPKDMSGLRTSWARSAEMSTPNRSSFSERTWIRGTLEPAQWTTVSAWPSCEDARLSRVFSRPAFDPLKQAFRPSPPALGQLGNRKQPLDLIAIAQVDAKYIADGNIMIGPLDNSDPILGADIALDDDSQVRPGSKSFAKAARERLVLHPDFKPPARYPRLGDLEHGRSDLPTLSNQRVVHLDSLGGEVFAKLAVCKRSTELPLPPPCVFDRIRVDRFIGSPVRLAICLVVSGEVHASSGDPTDGG